MSYVYTVLKESKLSIRDTSEEEFNEFDGVFKHFLVSIFIITMRITNLWATFKLVLCSLTLNQFGNN